MFLPPCDTRAGPFRMMRVVVSRPHRRRTSRSRHKHTILQTVSVCGLACTHAHIHIDMQCMRCSLACACGALCLTDSDSIDLFVRRFVCSCHVFLPPCDTRAVPHDARRRVSAASAPHITLSTQTHDLADGECLWLGMHACAHALYAMHALLSRMRVRRFVSD